VYDTTREGMSNGGHPYGAPPSGDDRADLLEYLAACELFACHRHAWS
jgi:hypothetical protein